MGAVGKGAAALERSSGAGDYGRGRGGKSSGMFHRGFERTDDGQDRNQAAPPEYAEVECEHPAKA